jgi:hypothetical protein
VWSASGEQAHPVPQLLYVAGQVDPLQPQRLCLLCPREQQQVVNQPADACDLRLHKPLDAPYLLPLWTLLSGQHFELAADHGQRRAQLVRGVGDERTLARECSGEAIEHVVKGVGHDLDLVALTADFVNARVQIPRVDPGSDGGHPPQRPRYAGTDRVGGEQSAGKRQQTGEHERAGDATLGLRHGGERLPHSNRGAGPAAQAHEALEQAQVADVRRRQRRVAVGRGQDPLRQPVLPILLGDGLAVVGRRRREQLRSVRARRRARDDREQQRRARAERLVAHVAAGDLGELRGGASPAHREVVRELARVAGNLPVDLTAQLNPGSAVDGDEHDPNGDQGHHRDPSRQAPAQPMPGAGQTTEGAPHLGLGREPFASLPRR